jgi:hypothetical protein
MRTLLSDASRDARYTLRMLSRAPAFALVAVVIAVVIVGLLPMLSHRGLRRGRPGFSDGCRLEALRGGGSAAIGWLRSAASPPRALC